eukprot:COSAG05_NODE_61_length_23137_cov_22.080693_7_plen_256_part_00
MEQQQRRRINALAGHLLRPVTAAPAQALQLAATRNSGCSGGAALEPFVPAPVLPGGVVLPIWPAGSTRIDQERAHRVELYDKAETGWVEMPSGPAAADAAVNSVRGVHNPSIEVHLAAAGGPGTAVLMVPGGGHNMLGLRGSKELVSFFVQQLGVSAVIVRPRLRIDGYNMTTDAVYDALQAIRTVRWRAREWGLDQRRIGIIGFSAGAELAAAAALEYDAFDAAELAAEFPVTETTSRPDFVPRLCHLLPFLHA